MSQLQGIDTAGAVYLILLQPLVQRAHARAASRERRSLFATGRRQRSRRATLDPSLPAKKIPPPPNNPVTRSNVCQDGPGKVLESRQEGLRKVANG